MDAYDEVAHNENPGSPPPMNRSRRMVWGVALLAAVVIAAMAFGAYRQPELLLNLMGLRYCG